MTPWRRPRARGAHAACFTPRSQRRLPGSAQGGLRRLLSGVLRNARTSAPGWGLAQATVSSWSLDWPASPQGASPHLCPSQLATQAPAGTGVPPASSPGVPRALPSAGRRDTGPRARGEHGSAEMCEVRNPGLRVCDQHPRGYVFAAGMDAGPVAAAGACAGPSRHPAPPSQATAARAGDVAP